MESKRAAIFFLAALIVMLMVIVISISLLPPAPIAPTPTWPRGVDLPDKLPRIPR